MDASAPLMTAAVAAAGLAIAAVGWALAERRRAHRKVLQLGASAEALAVLDAAIDWEQAWVDAFDISVLAVEAGEPRLVAGEDSFAAAAHVLGVGADPVAVLKALSDSLGSGPRIRVLLERGEPCSFHVDGPGGGLDVEGRTSGVVAWLRLSRSGAPHPLGRAVPVSSFLERQTSPAWVFREDGELVWANRAWLEAVERFWGATPIQLAAAGDFDAVAELCVPRLHDLQFWHDLKARVGDPDPQARVATSGEARTSDRRIVAYQSRPLPDGATLIAFADITDTRDLEQALADRSAALSEAERLKRDFVGNVSYELRTPLTTILGYAELLDHGGSGLPDRARGHVLAVRQAASQLARSIDDVLDVAQIDADEMALELGDVDLESEPGKGAAFTCHVPQIAQATAAHPELRF